MKRYYIKAQLKRKNGQLVDFLEDPFNERPHWIVLRKLQKKYISRYPDWVTLSLGVVEREIP